MDKANPHVMTFVIFFVWLMTGCLTINDVEACSDSATHVAQIMKKDALDRVIILWIDSTADPSLHISIDNKSPTAISLPGQECLSPAFDVTPEGDIVVTWTVLNRNTSVAELYSTSLLFGGSWSLPIVISHSLEGVIQGSNAVEAASANKIDVFWESLVFFPSLSDASVIKREVRTATGTISAWQPATTVGVIAQYGG